MPCVKRSSRASWPPAADVKEAELAAMLEMSKTPVREAMGRLCLEGLMQAFPRRGYRVTPVTVKDMNNLFELRAILEGSAAGLAAKNASIEQLDHLEEAAKAKYVIGEGESTKSFVASNHQFHIGIAKTSNNPRLISLIERHLEEGTRFLYMGTRARDVNFETNSDHQASSTPCAPATKRLRPPKCNSILKTHEQVCSTR